MIQCWLLTKFYVKLDAHRMMYCVTFTIRKYECFFQYVVRVQSKSGSIPYIKMSVKTVMESDMSSTLKPDFAIIINKSKKFASYETEFMDIEKS